MLSGLESSHDAGSRSSDVQAFPDATALGWSAIFMPMLFRPGTFSLPSRKRMRDSDWETFSCEKICYFEGQGRHYAPECICQLVHFAYA